MTYLGGRYKIEVTLEKEDTMKKIIIAVTACMLLYGCNLFLAQPTVEFNRTAFDRAQTAWEAQGITSYTFEAREFPGTPLPFFRITVTDGEITDVENIDEWFYWLDENPEALETYVASIKRMGTIPAVFDWIAYQYNAYRARLGTLERGESFRVDVTYNEVYNFPEMVSLSISSPRPINGGWSYFEIRNFQPIR